MSQPLPTTEEHPTLAPEAPIASAPRVTLRPVASAPAVGVPTADDLLRAEQVQSLVGAVRIALRKGRKDEARARIQDALALSPNDAGVLEALGDLCLEEGDQEKAIIAFEKGRKLHPQIAAFEEKIGLARIDLEERRQDALLRQQLLEQGDTGARDELSPPRALALSLLVPGAGHFYADLIERGAVFLGLTVLSVCGWAIPLIHAMNGAGEAMKREQNAMAAWSNAVASMSPTVHALFTVSMWASTLLYIVAAFDAARSAARLNLERRRSLGLE